VGPAGANGATNMVVRDSAAPVDVAANGDTATATVSCLAGEHAVGGGGITMNGNVTLTDSFSTTGPPDVWEVDYRNDQAAR
jgi:hypothetical protein